MKPRIELVPVEEARRLGAQIGIGEAQASRSAFRMLAHHPELAGHVFGLLRAVSGSGDCVLYRGGTLVLRPWSIAPDVWHAPGLPGILGRLPSR